MSNKRRGWLWFAGLYLGGVLVLTLAGMAIRLLLG
jgi:hypothetical protein